MDNTLDLVSETPQQDTEATLAAQYFAAVQKMQIPQDWATASAAYRVIHQVNPELKELLNVRMGWMLDGSHRRRHYPSV